MKVKAIWEFDVDDSDFDDKFVNRNELCKELTKEELKYLLKHGGLDADDFEYKVMPDYERMME